MEHQDSDLTRSRLLIADHLRRWRATRNRIQRLERIHIGDSRWTNACQTLQSLQAEFQAPWFLRALMAMADPLRSLEVLTKLRAGVRAMSSGPTMPGEPTTTPRTPSR
jgi:hypothetical protein